jgi:hypothetical protein
LTAWPGSTLTRSTHPSIAFGRPSRAIRHAGSPIADWALGAGAEPGTPGGTADAAALCAPDPLSSRVEFAAWEHADAHSRVHQARSEARSTN